MNTMLNTPLRLEDEPGSTNSNLDSAREIGVLVPVPEVSFPQSKRSSCPTVNNMEAHEEHTLDAYSDGDRSWISSFEPRQILPDYRQSSFIKIQSWDGYVREVRSDEFDADLYDSDDRESRCIGTFKKSEIAAGELELLREGAPFTWSVGHLIDSSASRQSVSMIRFRRFAPVSSDVLEEIMQNAERLYSAISYDTIS